MENQEYSRNATHIKMYSQSFELIVKYNCINLKIWWGNNVWGFLFLSLDKIQDTGEQELIGLSDLLYVAKNWKNKR